jgi:hypothetical protein
MCPSAHFQLYLAIPPMAYCLPYLPRQPMQLIAEKSFMGPRIHDHGPRKAIMCHDHQVL